MRPQAFNLVDLKAMAFDKMRQIKPLQEQYDQLLQVIEMVESNPQPVQAQVSGTINAGEVKEETPSETIDTEPVS